jgi:predicted ATP-binding protein involved in virulence
MRIESITFHNFKRLINANLKFGGNTTILVGQNESGKSTILDGLYTTTHYKHDSNLDQSFSKLKEEKKFETRAVIEVNESDIKTILSLAGLQPEENDKDLATQKFVFEWKGHNSDETRTVYSKWEELRAHYGNNSRLDSILKQLTDYVDQSIILLRSDNKILDSEPLVDTSDLVLVTLANVVS